ncbi:MAG TPA: sigma-70 family RNA polymerase sigma factor [Gemmatimonadota bacterium]|nr:sigma-70 family RNA polymerase sigma factor [Gemmatimonadota bacterium]
MSISDAELIAEVLRGRTQAFEALVRRHLDAAWAVALARTGNPEDAEDVCQDAFITALERLPGLHDRARFAGWLLEIVRNRALNLVRAREVRDALPLEAASPAAGPESPARDAERAVLRQDLVGALDLLTAVQREVVLLHDVEGWRHAEIAARIGLAEGTVRYHLHQARKALQERLAGRYPKEVVG